MKPFPWLTIIFGGLIVVILPFALAAVNMNVQEAHF